LSFGKTPSDSLGEHFRLVRLPTAGQDEVEVSLAEDKDVIQTLASGSTDQALSERVLPPAVGRREDFVDPHARQAMPELVAVDSVTITQEIGRRGLVREGVHDLLSGPGGGGMLGHIEVDDAPAVVSEHDEDDEDAQASGRHGEEIGRDQVADVVGEERPLGLRGLGAPLGHEPGDGALGDTDAELQELPVDARGTPQGIRRGDFPNEGSDLGIDGRAASGGPSRELGPVLAEAAALPAQDRVGRDDDQRLPPAGPGSGQPDPE
jgi:hypothetical protein